MASDYDSDGETPLMKQRSLDAYAGMWLFAVLLTGAFFVIPALLKDPLAELPDDSAEADVFAEGLTWTEGVPSRLDAAPSRLPGQSVGELVRSRARTEGATTGIRCLERDAPDLGPQTARIGCMFGGEAWSRLYVWSFERSTGELDALNRPAAEITPSPG